MPKKKTLDDFIVEALKLYGDKYDYSEAVYKNSSTKIKIICKEHGPFLKTPQKFINAKQGCRECTGYKKWSWERFVKEAKELYGGKYKYPKQKFTKTKALYAIICPIHGEFKQSIYHHLRGGCNKCAVEFRNENQRDTQEKYIAKAKKIHGYKYDYSKVKYTNSQTKIKIICSIHGEFTMKANNHSVQKQGCPACGRISAKENIKRKWEEVILRFKEKHKLKFIYHKETYNGWTEPMKIECSKHGEFFMKPHTHFYLNTGCPECGRHLAAESNRISWETLSKSFEMVHKGKYKYDKESYTYINKKMRINCSKHGWFLQTPSSHKGGSGCVMCANEEIGDRSRISFSDFISRAIIIHKNEYNYSKVEWVSQNDKVAIICKIHGQFYQAPRDHYRGSGCPKCSSSKGEKQIRNYCLDNYLDFEEQKTFEGLKSKSKLKCDFYFEELNLVIEYNGIQHYKPIEVFGGEKALKRGKELDKIKLEYCIKNNINFEVIKYDEDINVRMDEIISKY